MTVGKVKIIFDRPPKYIVIELLNCKPGLYDDLPPDNVLNYPVKQKYKYVCKTRNGSSINREFQKTQLPITPASAITEFKCQGTTLKKAIVGLDGGKIRAGVYIILSCVQKLKDVMILRPFNQTKLNITIDPNL
ncbi:3960_t:CDS:1 [Diversispora eburnea]|uniref:3960_t:CDS:1 n=1 Tax=Diversispora eburnea TaxID=1213867 RepID=A0A9N9D5B9_9GLOM|nr:3960_t:CDS:1 [Diversispora eburnea]